MKAYDVHNRKKRKVSNNFNDSAVEVSANEDRLEDDPVGHDHNSSNSREKTFHDKLRVIDCVTPEALLVGLGEGSGVILLKSDELKGLKHSIYRRFK